MVTIRPFTALRPAAELAAHVAALPYDVMSSDEARDMTKNEPYSFLHIDKAEIDLPRSVDLYDDLVYQTARTNLQRLMTEKVFVREKQPCFYLYRQVMDGRSQTGVVCCSSIDDYLQNAIKKHELTRADKEEDRCRHVDVCDAQTGPIFLTYHARVGVERVISRVCAQEPLYRFTSNGVEQTVWRVQERQDIDTLVQELAQENSTYIADGHHRAASAVRVGLKRRAENPQYSGEEEFNYFLTVLFPNDELRIMDYNRVVLDLGGYSPIGLLDALQERFTITACIGDEPCRPQQRHSFGMYLSGKWYLLQAKNVCLQSTDPVELLDVSILQNNVLAPLLGIEDPRTDQRIDFVGGIRGLCELERRAGESGVAFSMYPTSIDELMTIADAGLIMPPKSTWFEPKLLSGLFIHQLS